MELTSTSLQYLNTMKAIVYKDPNQVVVVSDRSLPKLGDHNILVKTETLALNPTDWKHIRDAIPKDDCILGVDFAGIVEEVGPSVTKPFQKGDRVAGFVNGGNSYNKDTGAFAEYVLAKEFTLFKIPDTVSFEEAATLGCGFATVGQGLFEKDYGLELALPSEPTKETEYVLIYGGSTASGTLGIQFAKLAGYKVISTSSPKNSNLLKSLGAEEVFDYKDPECGKKINEYTRNKLRYAWDCIATASAAQICADALTTEPGARYGGIIGVKFPREDVKHTDTLAYTGLGEDFEKRGRKFLNNEKHGEFQSMWFEIARTFLAAGRLRPHPVSVRPKGLVGAIEGMETMKKGEYSAEKLVYRVSETP
ncbi:alcohol dehydrogenase, putative [Talaromyces stipitatus ATCC 10500]|uniref:Alcohol dehydrogenase, putative n=1 Tax=Talaromyces stipitatus (strain ATCC 10500 / CBS 375.48 / QM 6759 / NRRL 1006) TaxID=441959 RepID=B8MR90_TALSN|nr:alcohol dehydrogenase, putative [Talaromyces stipitatus ATCC 10500]XP_002487097.1 alcohol dehydrogenase, putative [Talaromyces stipitatus ATCC 10500]EED12985.1 alcohol dehydrogenase, putative [Talaromyces stipitatus ATCC 10500]EED12986.1 alcohol dehydrogenase, putative [Talaromyces stipitatus ATCC 10500]